MSTYPAVTPFAGYTPTVGEILAAVFWYDAQLRMATPIYHDVAMRLSAKYRQRHAALVAALNEESLRRLQTGDFA